MLELNEFIDIELLIDGKPIPIGVVSGRSSYLNCLLTAEPCKMPSIELSFEGAQTKRWVTLVAAEGEPDVEWGEINWSKLSGLPFRVTGPDGHFVQGIFDEDIAIGLPPVKAWELLPTNYTYGFTSVLQDAIDGEHGWTLQALIGPSTSIAGHDVKDVRLGDTLTLRTPDGSTIKALALENGTLKVAFENQDNVATDDFSGKGYIITEIGRNLVRELGE